MDVLTSIKLQTKYFTKIARRHIAIEILKLIKV